MRDSLSFKLIRLLERELAHVARHDPHVPDESEPLESALAGADAVVVATNHSDFEDVLARLEPRVLLVDPWNVSGSGCVFGYAEELVRAGSGPTPPPSTG
jgi:UDP-N-acetyl-D-mannosaminuronic acid dehydrogenase